MGARPLSGPRSVLDAKSAEFPQALLDIPAPPEKLFVMGETGALQPGLAVIGARRATPYGKGSAYHFASIAASKGVCIISGGARGCDAESHKAALEAGAPTVVFLGGGCDNYYPACHHDLFQRVIDAKGALVSEYPWDTPPLPYMFRGRNRLIAGLAQALLIVEAGLPSGTFSTADDALNCGKDLFVVPGAITSATSRGSNRLLYQGAVPIVDDESFEAALFDSIGVLRQPAAGEGVSPATDDPLLSALLAQPMAAEDLFELARQTFGEAKARARMNRTLAEAEGKRLIERYPDGKWGPTVSRRP